MRATGRVKDRALARPRQRRWGQRFFRQAAKPSGGKMVGPRRPWGDPQARITLI